MAHHRFKLGQTVIYRPARAAILPSSPTYKIMRLLPPEGGSLLYRIKAAAEPYERVARESELALP